MEICLDLLPTFQRDCLLFLVFDTYFSDLRALTAVVSGDLPISDMLTRILSGWMTKGDVQ